jgi:excisionase family DNA binding protein
MLSVSVHTVARDVRLGRINALRYGRRVLIPREEILRIASEGMLLAEQVRAAV